jgi:hypothetical protein
VSVETGPAQRVGPEGCFAVGAAGERPYRAANVPSLGFQVVGAIHGKNLTGPDDCGESYRNNLGMTMKRLILLGLCAWPMVAGAQSDSASPQASDAQKLYQTSEKLLPIATEAGWAQACGVRSTAWLASVIGGLSNTVADYSDLIWINREAGGPPPRDEKVALIDEGRAVEASIFDGMHTTQNQCAPDGSPVVANWLAQADGLANAFDRGQWAQGKN